MTDVTRARSSMSSGMACARPTRKYPEGRTGTRRGYGAHLEAAEQPCEACRKAELARVRPVSRDKDCEEYVRYRLALAEYEARVRAGENLPACAKPTRDLPEGRTGTWAGASVHQRAHEPACTACHAAAQAYQAVHYQERLSVQRRAEYERNRDHYVERNYRASHGITLADYKEMLAAQDGRCAICGTDQPGGKHGKRFHIDHDHSCCPKGKSCEKCRRALLCANCNVGLGALGDDPDRLVAAASYLLGHGKGAAT